MAEDTLLTARREVAWEAARKIVDEVETIAELGPKAQHLQNRIEAWLLSRSDVLAPLLDAFDAKLVEVTREREFAEKRLADAQARVVRLEEIVDAHAKEVSRQCDQIAELSTTRAGAPRG